MSDLNISYVKRVAEALQLKQENVFQVAKLLHEQATVPFIARYRKELTGELDEVAIRAIRDTYQYISELEERKLAVIQLVEEDGKLTEDWKLAVLAATTKQIVEDLYAPFKKKRQTRASKAIAKGLEPLTDKLLQSEAYASWLDSFLQQSEDVATQEDALQGAADILAERMANDVEIKERLRKLCFQESEIICVVKPEFAETTTKFSQYYDYTSSVANIAAHQFLAMRRGEEQKILRLSFAFPKEKLVLAIEEKWQPIKEQAWLMQTIEDSLRRLLLPSLELDLRTFLKERADEESIRVFSRNLHDILMGPMAGTVTVLALDPGIRTGTKWAVVANNSRLQKYGTFYPIAKSSDMAKQAAKTLQDIIQNYNIEMICIGNGTASREVTQFVKDNLTDKLPIVSVNEAGASVYSASTIAREEFPELDLVYRGAISIARRFQDPLAELVKIDPKSIGVGQYQHDVNQVKLKTSLDDVIESCVNQVGVNVNTASYALLAYVSGLNTSVARNIVKHREENGLFQSRQDLLSVQRLGAKSFEQAAGFLKVPESQNPLDNSAVHPENYQFVTNLANRMSLNLQELVGNEKAVKDLIIQEEDVANVGKVTLQDIIHELAKPGRDPRKAFEAMAWQDDVQTITDLTKGMKLEGIITNMTKFGVFVDIGVHQDGLVHISEITNKFISDPADVCSLGDKVTVTVLDVQVEQKRISLSMKSDSSSAKAKRSPKKQQKVSWQDLQNKFNNTIR